MIYAQVEERPAAVCRGTRDAHTPLFGTVCVGFVFFFFAVRELLHVTFTQGIKSMFFLFFFFLCRGLI